MIKAIIIGLIPFAFVLIACYFWMTNSLSSLQEVHRKGCFSIKEANNALEGVIQSVIEGEWFLKNVMGTMVIIKFSIDLINNL